MYPKMAKNGSLGSRSNYGVAMSSLSLLYSIFRWQSVKTLWKKKVLRCIFWLPFFSIILIRIELVN